MSMKFFSERETYWAISSSGTSHYSRSHELELLKNLAQFPWKRLSLPFTPPFTSWVCVAIHDTWRIIITTRLSEDFVILVSMWPCLRKFMPAPELLTPHLFSKQVLTSLLPSRSLSGRLDSARTSRRWVDCGFISSLSKAAWIACRHRGSPSGHSEKILLNVPNLNCVQELGSHQVR